MACLEVLHYDSVIGIITEITDAIQTLSCLVCGVPGDALLGSTKPILGPLSSKEPGVMLPKQALLTRCWLCYRALRRTLRGRGGYLRDR